MESNNFIYGIGKDVFDKVPRDFDTLVLKEHYLANYMLFLMFLINKPQTTCRHTCGSEIRLHTSLSCPFGFDELS